MSEEEETFYVARKAKEIPKPRIPSVKLMCSGGCGEAVWVDKNTERLWSKVPVLCLECALIKIDVNRDSFFVAPESIESLMKFMITRDKSLKL